MYVYLIGSKVVLSAFPAVSYLTSGLSALGYGRVRVYVNSTRVNCLDTGLVISCTVVPTGNFVHTLMRWNR